MYPSVLVKNVLYVYTPGGYYRNVTVSAKKPVNIIKKVNSVVTLCQFVCFIYRTVCMLVIYMKWLIAKKCLKYGDSCWNLFRQCDIVSV